MKAFTVHTGIVAPLDRANVDTDAIIPKQFLKSIKRSGFGPNLFDAWRYLDKGEPGMDNAQRPLNPDFVLNEPRYRDGLYTWRTGFAVDLYQRKNFLVPNGRFDDDSRESTNHGRPMGESRRLWHEWRRQHG